MGLLTPLAVRIGAISWLPWLLPEIQWVDEHLHLATRGRCTLLDVAGLPNLVLTVPGRRSGLPRRTPLLCVPYGEAVLVAGSYFGGSREPAWVANLEAAHTAEIEMRGVTRPAGVRAVTGDERAAVWPHMLQTWPNFARYERRTDRRIKVFELTPLE